MSANFPDASSDRSAMNDVINSMREIGGDEAVTEMLAATRSDMVTLQSCLIEAMKENDLVAYREALHFFRNVGVTLAQSKLIAYIDEERTRVFTRQLPPDPRIVQIVRDLSDDLQGLIPTS